MAAKRRSAKPTLEDLEAARLLVESGEFPCDPAILEIVQQGVLSLGQFTEENTGAGAVEFMASLGITYGQLAAHLFHEDQEVFDLLVDTPRNAAELFLEEPAENESEN